MVNAYFKTGCFATKIAHQIIFRAGPVIAAQGQV